MKIREKCEINLKRFELEWGMWVNEVRLDNGTDWKVGKVKELVISVAHLVIMSDERRDTLA